MKSLGAKHFRYRAIEELHEAQAASSTDLRALHVRWANFYSDLLARLDTTGSD